MIEKSTTKTYVLPAGSCMNGQVITMSPGIPRLPLLYEEDGVMKTCSCPAVDPNNLPEPPKGREWVPPACD